MMIHKVIIINPINYWYRTLRPPFGLLTIATKFIQNGVEVVWVDADDLRDKEKVAAQVRQHRDADLIALGGLHTAYRYIKEFCGFLEEERINIPVIVGGRVGQTLKHLIWRYIPRVTIVCPQEGEYVVDSLCRNFNDISLVAGIEYRSGNKIIANKAAPVVSSLDEVPPLKWDLLSKRYYQYPEHTGRLITARGCPFRCYFCRVRGHTVEKYRPMSITQVIRDIEYMVKNYDVRRMVFMDELFLQNKKRVDVFCDHIKAFKIAWQCSSRGDSLRDDDLPLLKKMRSCGCDRIVMGIESGSPEMLKAMNKNLDIEKTAKSIELIRKAGMTVGPTFIFGYPGETRKTALDSVRWRKKMRLGNRFFYATPYPGSELYDIWKEKFSIGPDDEEAYMLSSKGLKDVNVNFTDLPDWKLRLLALECVIRLNSLPWIFMYFFIFPLGRIHPKIPETIMRWAIAAKGVIQKKKGDTCYN